MMQINIDMKPYDEALAIAAKNISLVANDIRIGLASLRSPMIKPHKWQKLRGSFYMRDGELVEAKSLDD